MNKPPIEYLKERADRTDLGAEEVEHRLSTHMIDYNSMNAGDYREFLSKRAEAAHQMAVKLCSGIEWD